MAKWTGEKLREAHHPLGGNAHTIAAFQRRTVSFEQFHHFGPAKHCCEHKRRHASAVIRVNIRAVFEQQGNDFRVPLKGGTAERGLATVVAAIGVCA